MAATTFPFYMFKEEANPVAWKTCLYFLRGPTKFLLWGLTRNAVSSFCMVQVKNWPLRTRVTYSSAFQPATKKILPPLKRP